MTTLILAVSIAAPPAVPFDPPAVAACECGAGCVCDAPCRCAKAAARDPYAGYLEAVRRAKAGETVVVYLGVPKPAGKQPLYAAAAPAFASHPADTGTYVLFLAGGVVREHRLAARVVERVSRFWADTGCYEVTFPDGRKVKFCPKGVPVGAAGVAPADPFPATPSVIQTTNAALAGGSSFGFTAGFRVGSTFIGAGTVYMSGGIKGMAGSPCHPSG